MLNVLESLDTLNIQLEAPDLREVSEAINVDDDSTMLIASDAKALLDPARSGARAILGECL